MLQDFTSSSDCIVSFSVVCRKGWSLKGNNFCLGYQTASLGMSVHGVAFALMYFVGLHFFTEGLSAYH